MKVRVKLFAHYRDGKFREREMELPEGVTAGQVIETLGLDLEKLPLGIVLIDGRHATMETELREGQTLSLFPRIGGG